MGPIIPTWWNRYKYSLTIIDGYSRCQCIENMHKKNKARLCVKQFVTFIKKQTRKSVKYLWLDQGREFGVWNLKSLTKEKGIKVELIVAYSPEINGIAERTNSLIASKTRYLLLNTPSKIGQSFWPEAFTIAVVFLNRSLLSFFKYDCALAVWLRKYNSSTKSYTPDLGHLWTFGCQVYAKILDKKRIKSQTTASVSSREGYFMSYTSESIYGVYFPNSRQIETVWDLEFDESYN